MVFGAIGRLFGKFKKGLSRTRRALGDALRTLVGQRRKIDRAFLDELEDRLLTADIGLDKTEEILERLQARFKLGEEASGEELLQFIKGELADELDGGPEDGLQWQNGSPTVILIVGVNGAGKTTTIAKLTKRFTDQGKSVLLAAGDTFRAAACEQLAIWADRLGVECIRQHTGADAAAVAFDAVNAAKARNTDVLLIDTAGRLHNKEDLMRELEKVGRVIEKGLPGAPHETLLVLDATAGQNAIRQAKAFGEQMGLTGLVLTKLDGTAKGGAVVTIKRELGLPVRYIGLGEQMEDLQPFVPEAFLDAILGLDDAES
jgi:fused signal recognition particle receptor